ncbi:MAG: hypothetical protein IJX25_00950, partial [Clostridia bacterium]|nr:hypothetical protein [Clostridia bacterium]
MIYVLLCASVILFAVFSYIFVKSYQLNGYNIGKFIENCCKLNFAYGDKNKLNFTKRIIRFYILLLAICGFLLFLPFYFVDNAFLVAFDVCVVFLFTPLWIALVHYLLWPVEELIKYYYICKAKKKLAGKKV